jgi:hypothetical protein
MFSHNVSVYVGLLVRMVAVVALIQLVLLLQLREKENEHVFPPGSLVDTWRAADALCEQLRVKVAEVATQGRWSRLFHATHDAAEFAALQASLIEMYADVNLKVRRRRS